MFDVLRRNRTTTGFRHGDAPVGGVLLVNLGTPDTPDAPALRRYLAEFLTDPRVIETPAWLWRPILHGIVLRRRPQRSARAYRKIWGEDDSPLRAISKRQARAVQEELRRRCAGPVHVALGMRYGKPSIRAGLEELGRLGVRRLLLFPLYPQYSATTTASTFDAAAAALKRRRWLPELRMVLHYHDHPAYIDALAVSIRERERETGPCERLLFSFHGIPRHYFLAGDPYHCECHKTARRVAEQLGLAEDDWAVSFQSRFGPRRWLKPYTSALLRKWAKAGIRRVRVVCPGFAADCLETLEEIRMQAHEVFVKAGGTQLDYVPALNDGAGHVQALARIVREHTGGWPEFGFYLDRQRQRRELAESLVRAHQSGARK